MIDWHPFGLHKRTWLAAFAIGTVLIIAQFSSGGGDRTGVPFGWPMVSHYRGFPYSGPIQHYWDPGKPGKKYEPPLIQPKRWLVPHAIALNLLFNAAVVASVIYVCEQELCSNRRWSQFSLVRLFWATTFAAFFLAFMRGDHQSPLWSWFDYPSFNIYMKAWRTSYLRLSILIGNGCLFYVAIQVAWGLIHGRVREGISFPKKTAGPMPGPR
jgi:hypothetical protein